ncbi:MFS transporter [Streptomyces sp. 5-6(2022)]|uniref:MFS transporter n=1 Tax=Streptomyces sp. 5-6(2022) TaxID=2936510 RepID=UPI0023B9E896|nr:MFS transporter [Streptomyces sp. 5-6(2022)]
MEMRAARSGALGQALEYFDFAVFGALSASLFPELFFSNLGGSEALLASFATFGIGFAARPIGGIVFGHLGDRLGRRPILYITLCLMGTSSIIVGLLPTGGGPLIASLLMALRFLQGLSLGGEATGAQIMVVEHARSNRRGRLGAFVCIGSPISQVAANLVLAVLSLTLTEQQWSSWGWRVPFLLSIGIVAVAAYVRGKLEETPAFERGVTPDVKESAAKPHGLGLRVLRTQPREIIRLALIWGGPALCFYLIAVYGLTLLKTQSGMSNNTAFVIMLSAHAVSIPVCLLGGVVSDRIGRKRSMLCGLAGCIVSLAAFFLLAHTGQVAPIAVAAAATLGSVQFAGATQPALFAEAFPTYSRFSGSALAYTLTNLVFSAPAPMIATALTSSGGIGAVTSYGLCVLGVSVLATWSLKDRTGISLVGAVTR